MTGVCLQVRAIAVLGRAVEVVVFLDELHHLILDSGKLLHGEFVLVWPHFLLAQEPQETELVLQQEKQSAATTIGATTCSAHSVDIIIGIIGRVELNDPVNLGEIKASLSDICAQKDSCFSLTEFEVSGCSLLLLLLAMDVLDRDVDVVEQIRVELDRVAAGHENHDLLLHVLPQEGEEELELASWLNQHISLCECGNCRGVRVFRNFN